MRVDPGLQWPRPSHANDPTTASPSQVPGLHVVFSGYLRHPPAPSHFPSVPQLDTGIVAHVVVSRGESPALRITHIPSVPAALQVLQPSVQAPLQHTPSTQKPLAHCSLHMHGSPRAIGASTFWQIGPASPPSPVLSIFVSPGLTSNAVSPPSGLDDEPFLQAAPDKTSASSAAAATHPTPTCRNEVMVLLSEDRSSRKVPRYHGVTLAGYVNVVVSRERHRR
jgi:hypothetical protein